MFGRFWIALGVLAAALALTFGAAQAQTQTLGVGRDWNASRSFYAIIFDVEATNPLTITTVTAGTLYADTFELYGRPGTHVGFEGSSAGWTLLGTVTIANDGVDSLSFPVNVPLAAGETYAFYINSYGGGRVGVTRSTAVGDVAASDANLTIFDGTTHVGTRFLPTGQPTPNRLAGAISYRVGLPAAVPTLSEWAMIVFGVLLLGAGAMVVQRRRLSA